MLYGKLENDKVTKTIELKELKELFPTIEFPAKLSNEILKGTGYVCIESSSCDLKQTKDTLVSADIKVGVDADGNPIYTREWKLIPYPDSVEDRVAAKFKTIRAKRDSLLARSDYTQLSDSQEVYAYNEYRQALRDLPESNEDPFLIEFPVISEDRSLEQGLKNYLEVTVKSLGFDDTNSVGKYLAVGNPYLAKATAVSNWIGACWVKAEAIKADVLSEARAEPTLEVLISELPAIPTF